MSKLSKHLDRGWNCKNDKTYQLCCMTFTLLFICWNPCSLLQHGWTSAMYSHVIENKVAFWIASCPSVPSLTCLFKSNTCFGNDLLRDFVAKFQLIHQRLLSLATSHDMVPSLIRKLLQFQPFMCYGQSS